jgi:hypothetical protein
MIEYCKRSGCPSTDHTPKDVVNTKFSMKTDEESFQKPMAGYVCGMGHATGLRGGLGHAVVFIEVCASVAHH